MSAPTGYAHALYAESLSEFGEPTVLPSSTGHLLKRQVPGSDAHDAMGCYPMFSCQNWRGLVDDLNRLEGELVSVSLVADPFGEFDLDQLRRCFPDLVVPFKEHVTIDLADAPFDAVTPHHRTCAHTALRRVHVGVAPDPLGMLDVWSDLYDALTQRRGIAGLRAFSRRAFAVQLATPGLVMLVASANGHPVGAHLWYEQGEVCHSHLSALSDEGRRLSAGFALYWTALEHFRARVRWLNLGAAAGARADGKDGLASFKRGWSRTTRPAFFCGRILNRRAYAALTAVGEPSDYFPSYRRGEF